MHQPLLHVSKNVDLSFYFLRTEIKRSHSVPSQDYMMDDSSNRRFECAQKCSCLSRCVRAHIVVVKSDPSSAVGFPDFLEGNWQTNGCVLLRIDCSVLFVWYGCNMSSFSEKSGAHLLGSASCASNFSWIWLIWKHPYSWTAVYFRPHTRKSTIHHLSRCHRRVSKHPDRVFGSFLWPIDTSLILIDWQIVWNPTRTNFFDSQMFI